MLPTQLHQRCVHGFRTALEQVRFQRPDVFTQDTIQARQEFSRGRSRIHERGGRSARVDQERLAVAGRPRGARVLPLPGPPVRARRHLITLRRIGGSRRSNRRRASSINIQGRDVSCSPRAVQFCSPIRTQRSGRFSHVHVVNAAQRDDHVGQTVQSDPVALQAPLPGSVGREGQERHQEEGDEPYLVDENGGDVNEDELPFEEGPDRDIQDDVDQD